LGVEITPDISYIDLRERALAACNSVALLEKHGLDAEPTPTDSETAAALTAAYAQDPQKTSKMVSNVRASEMTPASLINIRDYLGEYGRQVVTHAVEMRHLVTNRLLEESKNPDPRIRIRALELLGKHSDVGLFTDRSEVTITHQSTDELKARLRAKLQRLIQKPNLAEDAVEIGGDVIDVDAEMGFAPQNSPSAGQNTPENTPETENLAPSGQKTGEVWVPEDNFDD